MLPSQEKVLALLGLIASVQATSCPPCYTHTVAGVGKCPPLSGPETPCVEPQCVKLVSTKIPGPNPACPQTPTVTTFGPCPTAATCRKGCKTHTKTVTGTSVSCGVTWDTDTPSIVPTVTWDTVIPSNTGGVTWDTGKPSIAPTVTWETVVPPNTGGVTWDKPSSTANVSWDPPLSTAEPEPTDEPVTWNKRQDEAEPTDIPVGEPEEPIEEPEELPFIHFPTPTKRNSIGLQPPRYTITWYKRQDDAEPTDAPVPDREETPFEPDDPEEPVEPFFPFPIPTNKNSIELQPPRYTITWFKRQDEAEPTEAPLPEPEAPVDPEEPEEPEDPLFPFPSPTNRDSIGLNPPRYTITWFKRDDEPEPTLVIVTPTPVVEPIGAPTDEPTPEPTEEPIEEPVEDPTDEPIFAPAPTAFPPFPFPFPFPPRPSQSNDIGLQPPKHTITWDVQPEPTEEPTEPTEDPTEDLPFPPATTPVDSIGIQPPRATITWGKRQDVGGSIGLVFPTRPYVSWDRPHKPTGGVSWGKREPQFTLPPGVVIPPIPTLMPPKASITWGKRDDEEDGDLIITQPVVLPTNIIGLQPPKASVTWYRRNAAGGEDIVILPPGATPTNVIDLQPPKATVTWYKREPQIGLEPPSATITWYKRNAHGGEDIVILPPGATPTNVIDLQPPKATVTWYKREPQIGLEPPSATITWYKREAEAEAQGNTIGLEFPTGGFSFDIPKRPYTSAQVSWGKRDAEPQHKSFDWTRFWPSYLPTSLIPEPTGPGYVSWDKRDVEPAPTAAPTGEPIAPKPKCPLTTTVTRPVPCPEILCAPCPAPVERRTPDEPVVAREEPSLVAPKDCPVTITVPAKCPGCPPCGATTITKRPITTTFKSTASAPWSCPTRTVTIAPPCAAPPKCPYGDQSPCQVIPAIEKRVVTIETVRTKPVVPTPTIVPFPTTSAPPIYDCSPYPTITKILPCPTYTCIPPKMCPLGKIVR